MAPRYPREWEADVLLRNGRPVRLRPIEPTDADALAAFHASLSERTVYFRFFIPKPELSESDLARFTQVDHHDRVAFVALDAGLLVGVGRYDALGDGSAEVAFVVQDAMQGQGLGSILLEHLAAAARENGIHRFVAEVLPENGRMLATFREAGFVVEQHREEDVLALGFDIAPTETSRAVMAAREHRFEARSVHRLLHPGGVAVVGASSTGKGLGHAVLDHLARGGYRGQLVAVHPRAHDLLGVRCVPSLADTVDIDLAVVVVPAQAVASVVRDASAAGVHGLIVVSGGFDDAEVGAGLQAQLVELVHGAGMRLVGPHALGVINTDPLVRLNASLVDRMPDPGGVGLLCQSGALSSSILERFTARGVGVSTFVSAGNRADISGNDLLQYWEDDERTTVVALYLESIGNARKFARLTRRVAAAKPVVMVRSGGAGRRHPLGHQVATTSLSQRAVDEILAASGLLVVDDIEALVDVARVAAQQEIPSSHGVAIVSNSDAVAVLAANAIAGTSLRIVGEPRVLPRDATAERYGEALLDCAEDPRVGTVLAVHVPAVEAESEAGLRSVLRDCRVDETAVLAVLLGGAQQADGLTVFDDVERAVAAAQAMCDYAAWRRTVLREPEPRSPDDETLAPGLLDGAAALAVLATLGCPVAVSGAGRAGGPPGVRLRLDADAVFGDVVSVGVDDPIAEALGDASHRLAPVAPEQGLQMLAGLGAGVVLDLTADERAALGTLIASLSSLPMSVVSADLRQVRPGPEGTWTVEAATVRIGGAAPEAEVRRL